ncbi:MAG: histidine kinase [Lachnospiraceae bacterium]|nr:histidine kinase [Lachnospiraceae bacterium]
MVDLSILRILSAVFELTGIFITLIVLILYIYCMQEIHTKLALFMSISVLYMLFDLLALYFRYQTGTVAYYGIRIFNFLGFVFAFIGVQIMFEYVNEYLHERGVEFSRQSVLCMRVLNSVLLLLLVVNIFIPVFYYFDPQYTRGSFFWAIQLPYAAVILFSILHCAKAVRIVGFSELFPIVLYITLPIIAIVVQYRFYGLAIHGFASTISNSLLFVFQQLNHDREVLAKEKELLQKQTAISVSQIQPHFISNVLNTIQYLCDTDPEQASEITGKFAQYLRMNIHSISLDHPVDFKRDLQHLNVYVCIEKLRFPNLSFEYDIRVTNFKIPAMTLQPLVENSVRHGIRQIEEGGYVEVTTERDPESSNVILRIIDNGIGFEPKKLDFNEHDHVGLVNTRARLKMMCNADMLIKSAPGTGTEIMITLPQKETGMYNVRS